MGRFLAFLIILGGVVGGLMLYKDYAKQTKESRNTAAEEIGRIVQDMRSREAPGTVDDLVLANEDVVFRMLYQLHQAKKNHYSVEDTLKSTISGRNGRPVVEQMVENFRVAESLGVFKDLTNLLKLEQGQPPIATAPGWEDEPLAVGYLLSPTFAPEAATSLANLQVMPAVVRDMQSTELGSFSSENSKRWLAEKIITPESYRMISNYIIAKGAE
jgi:hypothetical protein